MARQIIMGNVTYRRILTKSARAEQKKAARIAITDNVRMHGYLIVKGAGNCKQFPQCQT
jgi:hypothetical protein